MIKKSIGLLVFVCLMAITVTAQNGYVLSDPEKKLKEAKQHFIQQEYGLAYPLLEQVQPIIALNATADNFKDDWRYYYTACRLKLLLPVAEEEAIQFIDWCNNAPRIELMSYHLA
ncbi:MAG: hypothetical protein RLY16_2655, partial [Bacteroidota bacterium]